MGSLNKDVKIKKSMATRLKSTFLPNSADSKKQKINIALNWIIAITLITSIILGAGLAIKYGRIRVEDKKNQELKPVISSSTDKEDDSVWHPSNETLDSKYGILPSFVELYEKNSDAVGWISIPNTSLDQPVLQGTDNSFYLNHSLTKQKYAFGVPFVDSRASISKESQSNNLTIYSHAAKDGSYFSAIKKYKDIDYYKQHPSITFNTIYGLGEYKILGFFIARVYNDTNKEPDSEEFNYHDIIDITTQTQLDAFAENITKRSYFNAPVDVMLGDQFITLSTCDDAIINSLSTPYRNVLVARRVRDGESLKIDVSKATANTQMIMPQAWVSKFNKTNPYK